MDRYKVRYGRHCRGAKKHGSRQIFKQNDIITPTSKTEEAFFKKDPGKFERVYSRVPLVDKSATLGKRNTSVETAESSEDVSLDEVIDVDKTKADLPNMTAKQLRELANELDVNVSGIVVKPELIKVITAALDRLSETSNSE